MPRAFKCRICFYEWADAGSYCNTCIKNRYKDIQGDRLRMDIEQAIKDNASGKI